MIYDIAIIGAGVAGSILTHRLNKLKKFNSILVIDIGRPPGKRRPQICGWLGCLPNSDGKIFTEQDDRLAAIVGKDKYTEYQKEFMRIFNPENCDKTVSNPSPTKSAINQLKKNNFEIIKHDFYQTVPKDAHKFSKRMAAEIDIARNQKYLFRFDEEVHAIEKKSGVFEISSMWGSAPCEYKAKKVVIAMGRQGWRQAHNLYKQFGIVQENDAIEFGMRIEIDKNYATKFNGCVCSWKHEDFTVGPMLWDGTVIPEDHVDLATTAFRSNENRWISNKVSFSILAKRIIPGNAIEEMDRLSKLVFVLNDEKVLKEKVSQFMTGKSRVTNMIDAFGWIGENNPGWMEKAITKVAEILPDIYDKGMSYSPTIIHRSAKVNLTNSFESDVPGMYIIGENAGIPGLANAAVMGLHLADNI